jgi:hypothetical protein
VTPGMVERNWLIFETKRGGGPFADSSERQPEVRIGL